MDITLISTIYNLNPYINTYIDSLNNLSNKNINYILIDANSSDDVKGLVVDKINLEFKRYIKFNFRINYFNSIIEAIKLVETEYFFILDTDDAIKVESVDLFQSCIDSYRNTDMFLFKEEIDFFKHISNLETLKITKANRSKLMHSFLERTVNGSMTSKLIKKSLFDEVLAYSADIKYSPDILLSFIAFKNAYNISEASINYHIQNTFNSGSLNRSYLKSRFFDYKYVYDFINNVDETSEFYFNGINRMANLNRFLIEIFYDFVMTYSSNHSNLENPSLSFMINNIQMLENNKISQYRSYIMKYVIRSRFKSILVIVIRFLYKFKFFLDYVANSLRYYKNKSSGVDLIYDFNNNSSI